ncbi:hypothetical protein [Thalassovita gelatinovora]|uniref:hypothetical protein n=1 Tax=Thalassovita gelatinovora TaxID=53501 RepID=UPI00111410F4|nr:hypothetical protein [Thalassovita gelatinovora]QIZ82107.1 hypothetical protein HFZ77_17305 [Thalassovita gelatinovora]
MARVFLDVNLFGQEWFGPIKVELQECSSVRFSYSRVQKLLDEHQKNVKAKTFYQIMSQLNRVDVADSNAVQKRMDKLQENKKWKNEKDCDDPHIFAIVYEMPTPYVFSSDTDMANCRRCIQNSVDSKFCQFIVIASDAIYRKHRQKVLK